MGHILPRQQRVPFSSKPGGAAWRRRAQSGGVIDSMFLRPKQVSLHAAPLRCVSDRHAARSAIKRPARPGPQPAGMELSLSSELEPDALWCRLKCSVGCGRPSGADVQVTPCVLSQGRSCDLGPTRAVAPDVVVICQRQSCSLWVLRQHSQAVQPPTPAICNLLSTRNIDIRGLSVVRSTRHWCSWSCIS